jgi:hypothetical protein
MGEEGRENT